MKVLFEYDGHKIMLSRGVLKSELYIDSEVCDTCNGFTNNQMKSFDLSGTAVNSTGDKNDVRIRVDVKLFHDNVSLYYAGRIIETRKVSMW